MLLYLKQKKDLFIYSVSYCLIYDLLIYVLFNILLCEDPFRNYVLVKY